MVNSVFVLTEVVVNYHKTMLMFVYTDQEKLSSTRNGVWDQKVIVKLWLFINSTFNHYKFLRSIPGQN